MRLRELSISVATTLTLIAVPAFAGTKGPAPKSSAPKAIHASPKITTATHGRPTMTTASTPTTTHGAPKTTIASAPKTKHGGPKTTTAPTATKTHGQPKTTTAATAAATRGSSKKAAGRATTTVSTSAGSTSSSTSTSGSTSGSTSTTTSGGDTTTTELNPIARKISTKSNLGTKVTGMLPSGMTLNEASKGFKNQGQFLAALHVSRNLGIPFADLKTAMTGIRPVVSTTGGTSTGGTTSGTTTTGGTSTGGTTTEDAPILSLGQAIHKLRPKADAATAETTATNQANADLSGK